MNATNDPATSPDDSVVNQPTPDAVLADESAEDRPAPETRPGGPAYITDDENAPKNETPFTNPGLEPCPKCSTGLLYVIGWDHKALHEVGQPIYAPNMLSGGSVQTKCFVCDYGETFALAPRPAPVNPQSGA